MSRSPLARPGRAHGSTISPVIRPPDLWYEPASPDQLDIEICKLSVLRRRVQGRGLSTAHRHTAHMLLCVTRGSCRQIVDFETEPCSAGTFLALRPGQVHDLGRETDWDGWMVFFRPEFIRSETEETVYSMGRASGSESPHVLLNARELRIVSSAIGRMHADAESDLPRDIVEPLLRHQLYALLLRVHAAHAQHSPRDGARDEVRLRFNRFARLVDAHFSTRHQVAAYASELGCSEKTLLRTTREIAGVGAKAFVVARISLEAKRLLAHTTMTITAISEQLGFDEATNFVKFFKREVGCVPEQFRRRHGMF